MTTLEANEEARVALANAKWNGEKSRIEADVLGCLLATAEREAKLREAATAVLSRLDYLQGLWGAEGVTTRLADDLRAALESKGGE